MGFVGHDTLATWGLHGATRPIVALVFDVSSFISGVAPVLQTVYRSGNILNFLPVLLDEFETHTLCQLLSPKKEPYMELGLTAAASLAQSLRLKPPVVRSLDRRRPLGRRAFRR